MEIIIDREADLILSWAPHAYWIGGSTYDVGPIGRTGPVGMRGSDSLGPRNLPDSLIFYIRFKDETDLPLYLAIRKGLEVLKTYDEISINQLSYHNGNRKSYIIREKGNLYPVYEKEVAKIEKENKLIEAKYLVLVDQLEELGCDCDDLKSPKYQTIPNDWYEWNESIDINRDSFNICCHKGTKFYQHLQKHGILNKYFPEWYRMGNF
jgi:hypothetical protein